jgi:hypothetical protein
LLSAALASAASGRIAGMVVDPKGTGVGGARLKLVDTAGATVQETQSDEQGPALAQTVALGGTGQ